MSANAPEPPGHIRDRKIRALLVHEHAIIREGLRILLEQCDTVDVVGEAETCAESLKLLNKSEVDIILLDIDLRLPNSIDILSILASTSPNTRLLILNGVNDPELSQRALKCGAAGLFLKDQRCGVLIEAIKKVAEGEVWLDRSLMAAVLVNLTRGPVQGGEESDKISSLTRREREIIELVCRGMRNREIADQLFIGEKTVRNHMASIFSKLDVTHRLGLAVYANKHKLATIDGSVSRSRSV